MGIKIPKLYLFPIYRTNIKYYSILGAILIVGAPVSYFVELYFYQNYVESHNNDSRFVSSSISYIREGVFLGSWMIFFMLTVFSLIKLGKFELRKQRREKPMSTKEYYDFQMKPLETEIDYVFDDKKYTIPAGEIITEWIRENLPDAYPGQIAHIEMVQEKLDEEKQLMD
ncbi:MAG: hypothetical protein ACW99A_22735 [Candidatus Kariarchaeaceae archaeon]